MPIKNIFVLSAKTPYKIGAADSTVKAIQI
jgi:hypothetical protein